MDLTGSGYGFLFGFCKQGVSCENAEFLDQLATYNFSEGILVVSRRDWLPT
jgi:hypothetical protein